MTESMPHPKHNRLNWLCAAVLLASAADPVAAQTATAPPNAYLVHNLISDLANTADHQDPNLVNPWGIGFGPTPFWAGNNGTGTATLYTGAGATIPLVVTIPQAASAGTAGPVTGVIFNSFASNTNAFDVQAGKPALFIFCSEDGDLGMESDGERAQSVNPLRQLQIRGHIYRMRCGWNRRRAIYFRGELQYRNSGRVRRQPQSESGAVHKKHSSPTLLYVVVVFESGNSSWICSIQHPKYRWHAVCDLRETERSET